MTDLLELAARVEAAIPHMTPAERNDTADYAEITGPAFMMMTMRPTEIMGLLEALPDIAKALRARAVMEGGNG